jgi:flagellar protein FliO/FliZ
MDLIDFARYIGALALVLGLVGFAALAAKRYGIVGIAKLGGGSARRLSLVETMMVGAKHKLILIKRDGVEHLVLIGPDGATVVENGIDAPPLAQILALHDSEAA